MKGEAKPLDWWLKNLAEMPTDVWLYIERGYYVLTPSIPCIPVTSYELSPEEQDSQDEQLAEDGLSCLFCQSQLEDIISNLVSQRPNYSQHELYQALNFYWQNDAFIEIPRA